MSRISYSKKDHIFTSPLPLSPASPHPEIEDVIPAICFLLSDRAAMINGIMMPIDGGSSFIVRYKTYSTFLKLEISAKLKSAHISGSPMMVDVIRLQHRPRKLLQQVSFFVRQAIPADHADRLAAARVEPRAQLTADVVERSLPRGRLKLASSITNQRRGDAIVMVRKVECVATLIAEEVAIHAAFIAIISANNLRAIAGRTHT